MGGIGGVRSVLGLAETLGTQGPDGYREHQGPWGLLEGVGPLWGVRGCRVSGVYWGWQGHRRYRGTGGIRGNWGLLGV